METDRELKPKSKVSNHVDFNRKISDGKPINIDDLLNFTLQDIESITIQSLSRLNIDQIFNLLKIVAKQREIHQTIIDTHGIIWKVMTFISKKNQKTLEQEKNQIEKLQKWYYKLKSALTEMQFFSPPKDKPAPTIQTSEGDADDWRLL
jgi:hypothetical protein